MRNTRTWMYFVLPFLYVAVILGFVGIQFSKKSDSFSQSLGDLTLSGKTANGDQPAELTLRGRGVQFLFDANHVLSADTRVGSTVKLRPRSWEWKDGNVLVTFQQGVKLAFEKVGAGGRSLVVRPVATDGLRALAALHIPFAPENGTRLNRGNRSTVVELVRDKTRIVASVDGALDRIETDNTFVLTAGTTGFRPARLDPLGPDGSPDLTWLTLEPSNDPAGAEAALNQYWDKAYVSWATRNAFSTALADAWAREALARGSYPETVGRIQGLPGQRDGWGFDASPYLGDIVSLTSGQRRAVEAASSRSQPDWATQRRLWLDARYYGPPGSADRVKGLLMTGKLPDDGPGLIGVYQNLVRLQVFQPSDALTARINEVQKALVSRVVRREGDVFVATPEGLFDLKSSLLLGRAWLDSAKTQTSQTYAVLGAGLVASGLARLDTAGRLPEILVTQDGKVVRQEGTLLPEDLYAGLKPAPAWETELPAWGPTAFVRSPAKLVSQTITDASARFTFRFPTGTAEHIVISGVRPFDHITMHGIRWRTDPQFQSYTDGWAYSAATQTLYFKIKHREDLEEVIVHFQPEE